MNEDTLDPEIKLRIAAALARANKKTEGMTVEELQEAAEIGFQMANNLINGYESFRSEINSQK